MNATIAKSGPPVREEELAEVEQRLGEPVPAAYKRFLLAHNGGRPDPRAYIIYGHDGAPFDEGSVTYFLGVRPGEIDDLEEHVEIYENRIPAHFFPIAVDPGGNLLCISTAGNDAEAVYFWDHEEEANACETPGYDNVYFVASSFEDLLDRLQEPT